MESNHPSSINIYDIRVIFFFTLFTLNDIVTQTNLKKLKYKHKNNINQKYSNKTFPYQYNYR